MSKEYVVLHLVGPGMSGRGVKLRRLKPSEMMALSTSAAKQIDPSLGPQERHAALITHKYREGALRCLVAVTDSSAALSTPCEPGKARTELDMEAVRAAKWHTLTPKDLEMPGSPWHYDEIFTAKDLEVLDGFYIEHHEAPVGLVQAIMGKALTVSED